MKLNVKAFSLTCAIIWGLAIFGLTWWVIAFNDVEGISADGTLIGSLYRGYSVSPIGSLIGLAWAFLDGLIGGAIFALVYNFFAGLMGGKKGS